MCGTYFSSIADTKKDYPLGYIPSIDGSRGIMAFCVLLAHVNYNWFPGAIVFMNVFFISSSYLITMMLLRDWEKYATIRFKTFYIRRFLRLFPAYYIMLFVFVLIFWLAMPTQLIHYKNILYAGLYMTNWVDTFSHADPKSLFAHTWSLSVEEQFYLCWPVLLFLLITFIGLRKRLIIFLLMATACCAIWRYWLAVHGATIGRLYAGTDVRADTLLIGCVIAILLERKIYNVSYIVKLSHKLIVPLAIIIFLVFGFLLNQHDIFVYTWGTTLIDVSIGIFLIGIITTSGTIVHKFFETPFFVYLGKMSYATYIWHFPIIKCLYKFHFIQTKVLIYGIILTYIMSFLSYKIIEKPCMRLKRKFS